MLGCLFRTIRMATNLRQDSNSSPKLMLQYGEAEKHHSDSIQPVQQPKHAGIADNPL